MNIERCPFTDLPINLRHKGDPGTMLFTYETPRTGPVVITDVAIMEARALPREDKNILAGIARNAYEEMQPPVTFNSGFLRNVRSEAIPFSFVDRARHFLKYLYSHGGKEYKPFNINSVTDSLIAYASSEEFERMISYLKDEDWIDTGMEYVGGAGEYHELTITKSGIKEVEKGQPRMPMAGLISQKISTGEHTIDANIEHARKAFFDEPTSFESKRSACETLAYILEPLRKELDGMFEGDTEFFFNVVNTFSVRHNKLSTKRINSEEQLEWIFYSLLNTINTYVKMKRKVL